MPSIHCVVAICATAILLAGCSGNRAQDAEVRTASPKPEAKRTQAPDFALKDMTGQSVRLSGYRGKVVLLNFWETTCGPCKIEIPWFMEFEQQYKDRGFAVLGVALDEQGWEIVRPYVREQKINYRILLGTDGIAQLYGGIDALPTTFLVDRQGRIASTHIGLISKGDYKSEIDQLLGSVTRAGAASLLGAGSRL